MASGADRTPSPPQRRRRGRARRWDVDIGERTPRSTEDTDESLREWQRQRAVNAAKEAEEAAEEAEAAVAEAKAAQEAVSPVVTAKIVDTARALTASGLDGPTRYLIEVVHLDNREPPYVIARRYSEFDALRRVLGTWAEPSAEGDGAPFPAKHFVGSWQAAVVVERRIALQRWLARLLVQPRGPPELAQFLVSTAADQEMTAAWLQRLAGTDKLPRHPTTEDHGTLDRTAPATDVGSGPVSAVGDAGEWACRIDAELPIRTAGKGAGAMKPRTLPQLLEMAVERHGNETALEYAPPRPEDFDAVLGASAAESASGGTVQGMRWTWREYKVEAEAVAKGLIALGIHQTQQDQAAGACAAAAVLSDNSPRWHMAWLGIVLGGAKAVGLYTSASPRSCETILKHCGARVIFVGDASQLRKFTDTDVLSRLAPNVKAVVEMHPVVPSRPMVPSTGAGGSVRVLTWEMLLELGRKQVVPTVLAARVDAQRPGQCCCVMYPCPFPDAVSADCHRTSEGADSGASRAQPGEGAAAAGGGAAGDGTRQVDGVMFSHDNLCWTAAALLLAEPTVLDVSASSSSSSVRVGAGKSSSSKSTAPAHKVLSYLPLSDSTSLLFDLICPLIITANGCDMTLGMDETPGGGGWGALGAAFGLGAPTDRAGGKLYASTAFAGPTAFVSGFGSSCGGDGYGLLAALQRHRPTMFFGVPRVWENLATAINVIALSQQSGDAKATDDLQSTEVQGGSVTPARDDDDPSSDVRRDSVRSTTSTQRSSFNGGRTASTGGGATAAALAVAKGSLSGTVTDWAVRTAAAVHQEGQAGGYHGWRPFLYPAASGILRATVQARLGLDNARLLFCTGGYHSHPSTGVASDVLEFFGGLDMHILQLYVPGTASSEAAGLPVSLCCASIPDAARVGSSGLALPGVELAIDHVHGRDALGDGEVLVRGRNVMMGFLLPSDDAQCDDDVSALRSIPVVGGAGTSSGEGQEFQFLRTGDVGSIDRFGLLSITGRLRELVHLKITASGAADDADTATTGGAEASTTVTVAPARIEAVLLSMLRQASLPVSSVVVVGEDRPHLGCLIALTQEDPHLQQQLTSSDDADAGTSAEGAAVGTYFNSDPSVAACVGDAVQRYNDDAAATSGAAAAAHRVDAWRVLPEEFSVAKGELTQSLKLRRAVVLARYQALIDEMYSAGDESAAPRQMQPLDDDERLS